MTLRTQLLVTYCASLFYSFHYALPLYSESSYLHTFINESNLGFIYGGAALLSLLLTLNVGHYLNRFSNYKLTLTLLTLEAISLVVLGSATSDIVRLVAFFAHQVFINLVYLTLNIFIEELTRKGEVGRIRGMYLTVLNTGILVAPFIGGMLFSLISYPGILYSAALLVVPTLALIGFGLHHLHEPKYKAIAPQKAIDDIWYNKDLRNIWLAQFLLEVFYAIMIIYSPIYLARFGISLEAYLGIIMPIILLPFVIFPYGLGRLADKKTGEQEFLILGFILLFLSCVAFAFTKSGSLLVWVSILGVGRIGASIVEAMASSYFYKKIDMEDSNVVALFTNTRPTALIVASLASAALLTYVDLQYIFILLGITMLFGIRSAIRLQDTR